MKAFIKILIFFVISKFSVAFMLYPKELKKDITKGALETFTIVNTCNQIYVVRVESSFKNVDIKTQIYPKVFILNPQEEKFVKISLQSDKNLENQMHTGKIKFTLIPVHLKEFNNIIVELCIDAEVYTQR
ncbi:hypothetical protein [Cetobacterium sp. 2G large]|uniref:hypothetical protein n=1 Tax=Cetobacterium sp. 2G large TaxID=2759680 RepID=UPI00163C2C3A|nr:hypothetical protein [Cetobacterium sp. 2G large]MBC2854220.1 hypothetical protein [Cetobacterium sp. 2G large]